MSGTFILHKIVFQKIKKIKNLKNEAVVKEKCEEDMDFSDPFEGELVVAKFEDLDIKIFKFHY